MLQNPFFIIRYASFSLILFLNVITLIFAAWNVAAMKSSGNSAPGAPVLIIFNGAALFLSILTALAGLIFRVQTAKLKYESMWTALISILQLAAALTITTNGPPLMCQPTGNLAVCTSATVLVPVTWLSAFTTVVYFLILTIMTIVYAQVYPEIWSMSIYDVPWFTTRDPPPAPLGLGLKKRSSTTLHGSQRSVDIWAEDLKEDEEAGSRLTKFSLKIAPWARGFQTNQRGVDRAFATRSQVVAANADIPPPPPKSHPPPIASRYLSVTRQDNEPEMPRDTFSQWIRDDAARGRSLHTKPPISPW